MKRLVDSAVVIVAMVIPTLRLKCSPQTFHEASWLRCDGPGPDTLQTNFLRDL
jgi:hypothetical protein